MEEGYSIKVTRWGRPELGKMGMFLEVKEVDTGTPFRRAAYALMLFGLLFTIYRLKKAETRGWSE